MTFVDPLAAPTPAPAPAEVYGEIYELHTRGERGAYVGLARGEDGARRRVYGRGGHTSRASVAKDPWKARILPDPHGFTVIDVVYATGDPAEDERTLRNAEAYWIRKYRTRRNTQRPAYAPDGSLVTRSGAARPVTPRPPSQAALRARSAARARRAWLVLVAGLWALDLLWLAVQGAALTSLSAFAAAVVVSGALSLLIVGMVKATIASVTAPPKLRRRRRR